MVNGPEGHQVCLRAYLHISYRKSSKKLTGGLLVLGVQSKQSQHDLNGSLVGSTKGFITECPGWSYYLKEASGVILIVFMQSEKVFLPLLYLEFAFLFHAVIYGYCSSARSIVIHNIFVTLSVLLCVVLLSSICELRV